jgi:hypothetical protein
MAIPGNIQALIAAFSFGIVVNAASAALFLYVKGHGSTIFRDGLRLVLITFLAGSALWAQVDFIATVIDPTATSGCQVAILFSTAFDQIARVSMEQFILWAINSNAGKPNMLALITQLLLALRFIAGAVLVGFSRPQFNPVCVARTEVVPIGGAVVGLDVVLVLVLAAMAFSVGAVNESSHPQSGVVRGRGLLFTIVGFGIWTGVSKSIGSCC